MNGITRKKLEQDTLDENSMRNGERAGECELQTVFFTLAREA